MTRFRRIAALGLLGAACLVSTPRDSRAQGVPAAYGLITGTIGGIYVTTAIFVTKARAGSFLYSLEDAFRPRWELFPVVVMPIGSVVVGLDDGQRLANGIKWGSAGFAAGAVVGFGVGTVLRETGGESQWAGAIIGSAAGLLAGSLYGTLSYDDEEDGSGADFPLFTLRFPL